MSSPRVVAAVRPRPPRFCGAERLQRGALDEAVAGEGHDHLAGLDQALVVLVGHAVDDRGQARRGDLGAHRFQLGADHLEAADVAAEQFEKLGDAGCDLGEFLVDFLALQAGEASQASDPGCRAPAPRSGGRSRRSPCCRRRRSGRAAAARRPPASRAPSARAGRRCRRRWRGSGGSPRRCWRPRSRGRPAGARARAPWRDRKRLRRRMTSSR